MTDVLTKKQRSYTMSRIRSKWTFPEQKIHNFLKGKRIKHTMHPKLAGNPDILLKNKKTVIFIHGCYWHKCQRCFVEPKTNEKYWIPKIESNLKRDRKNKSVLRREGFKVITIWEHQVKKEWDIISKMLINQSGMV